MSDSVEELRQHLAATTDRLRKIDLTLEIATSLGSTDPAESLRLAKSALRLSITSRQKSAIARSNAMIGMCERYLGNYPAALDRLQAGLELSRETGEGTITAHALQQIGIVYVDTGESVRGIDMLGQSLEIAVEIGDRSREASVQNSLGCACNNISDYTRAIEHLFRSQQIYEELNDTSGLFGAINNMGTTYMALENLPKAREQFLRCAELAAPLGNRRFELAILTNLGAVFYRLGHHDEALDNYVRALELTRQLNSPPHEGYLLFCIGMIRKDRHEYPQALDVLHSAFAITERIGDPRQWSILASTGEVEFRMGETDAGLDSLTRALAEATNVRNDVYEIHRILADLYEANGDNSRALEHHRLFTRIREEVVGQEQQRAMMQMEMRAEIERMEREREILRLKNQRLETEMEQAAKELTAMALHLVEKNQFLDGLKRDVADVVQQVDGAARPKVRGILRQVEGGADKKEGWKAFEAQFERVHDGFLQKLSQRCPTLTRTELKVCALLRINMASKEIAEILNSSTRTVEHHRLNIRRKLELGADVNFAAYFAAL